MLRAGVAFLLLGTACHEPSRTLSPTGNEEPRAAGTSGGAPSAAIVGGAAMGPAATGGEVAPLLDAGPHSGAWPPDATTVVPAPDAGPLALGSPCESNTACLTGYCYGEVHDHGFQLATCQSGCLPSNSRYYCNDDADCCEDTYCCIGCGEQAGMCLPGPRCDQCMRTYDALGCATGQVLWECDDHSLDLRPNCSNLAPGRYCCAGYRIECGR